MDSSRSPTALEEVDCGLDVHAVGESIFGLFSSIPVPEVTGYIVERFIARGGLGHVWEARREADGGAVALKIPHAGDAEPGERLIAESESLGALRHPNIVRRMELLSDREGNPVLVMELVRGGDLRRRIPAGGLGFEEALDLFLPVLDALDYAHSQGVMHRDIKPANILLTLDGIPKVADFGLAKSLASPGEKFSLTLSGAVAGTTEYLAPEFFETGTSAGVAADIYALGIMFYEMLTGHPPRGFWPPLSQVKRLDLRLDALMAEAIHPEPGKRLQSVAEFARRLREIRGSRPVYADTPVATLPVRGADLLWTVAGIYCTLAGFQALQRLNGVEGLRVLDLTMGHGGLLGGMCASWFLTVLLGGCALWQGGRLLLFRRVGLREALPGPFGMVWGGTRGAALVVGLGQIICMGGGLCCLAEIFQRSNHWLSPETSYWLRGLCVTAPDQPLSGVSPWRWDPPAFFNAGAYALSEAQPGSAPGRLQVHDSQFFLIFIQPLLMVLGAAGIAFGLLVTLIMEWRRKRRRRLILLLLLLTGLGAGGWLKFVREGESRLAKARSFREEMLPLRRAQAVDPLEWGELAYAAFDERPPAGRGLPELVEGIFDENITHDQLGVIPRTALLNLLLREKEDSRRFRRRIEAPCYGLNQTGNPFPVGVYFQTYTEPDGGLASGNHVRLIWRGRLLDTPPHFLINQWDTETVPLYETRPQPLDQETMETWLRSFLEELGRRGCPDLETYALPTMLTREPGPYKLWAPNARAELMETLRRSRSLWTSLEFFLLPGSSLRARRGGRWEITASINRMGTRADGEVEQPAVPMTWRLEIVPVKNSWRLLRVEM